jgi:alkyl sulfatase BDS1-like metallo-beta-lactamase superfamily hydrolase
LNFGTPTVTSSPDILAQLPPEMFLDAIAVPVDGPRAWDLDLAIRWAFPDHGATFRVTLANGVPTHVGDGSGEVSLTMTVPRAALAALATGDLDAAGAGGLSLDCDQGAVRTLFAALDPGDPDFNIVEP